MEGLNFFKNMLYTPICVVLLSIFLNFPIFSSPLRFTNIDKNLSEAGYVTISWELDDNLKNNRSIFLLEQSLTSEFNEPEIIYKGLDTRTFISGLKEGNYFYRVKLESLNSKNEIIQSEIHRVTVKYHSFLLTLILFFTGLFIFIILLYILLNELKTKNRLN